MTLEERWLEEIIDERKKQEKIEKYNYIVAGDEIKKEYFVE